MAKRPAGYWIILALLAATVAYNIWAMGRTVYNFPTSYFVGETYFGLKLLAIALLLRRRAESVYFLIGAFVIGLMMAATIYWELGFWNALRRYEGFGWIGEIAILLAAIIYMTVHARRETKRLKS
jgi:hypothetical protein